MHIGGCYRIADCIKKRYSLLIKLVHIGYRLTAGQLQIWCQKIFQKFESDYFVFIVSIIKGYYNSPIYLLSRLYNDAMYEV